MVSPCEVSSIISIISPIGGVTSTKYLPPRGVGLGGRGGLVYALSEMSFGSLNGWLITSSD